MLALRNAILCGLIFGLLYGGFYAVFFSTYWGICKGLYGIVIVVIILYRSQTAKRHRTDEGEIILRSGVADHVLHGETGGGRLYLLADKLRFLPNRFNPQDDRTVIGLSQIRGISFYNTWRFVPNGLAITLTNGQTEEFAVSDRQGWKADIEKALALATVPSQIPTVP